MPNMEIRPIPRGMVRTEVKWVAPDWWGAHGVPRNYDWGCSKCGALPHEIVNSKKCEPPVKD